MREPSDRGNIVLVGFMGAGKSTVGRQLELLAGYRLIDLDAEIVRNCGRSIPEIFAVQGEGAFREMETEALRQLAGIRQTVIATGGGIVGRPENWRLMRDLGRVVYLDCAWEILQRRITSSSGRPLAADGDWERVRQLWENRLPLYRQADLVVRSDSADASSVGRTIMALLDKKEKECWRK